jgi:hypothetical protein
MRKTAMVIGLGALFLAGSMILEQLNLPGWSVSGWCATFDPPRSLAALAFILVLIVIGVATIVHSLRSVEADRELSEGLGLRDQMHNNK